MGRIQLWPISVRAQGAVLGLRSARVRKSETAWMKFCRCSYTACTTRNMGNSALLRASELRHLDWQVVRRVS